jgi:hypothetical protein
MLFLGTRQKLAMRLVCPSNLVSIPEGTGFSPPDGLQPEIHMRCLALLVSASIVAACSTKDSPPTPSTPPSPPVAPNAQTSAASRGSINLASIAGTWNFKVMGATNDSVLTTYTLVVTTDTTGWIMTLPNRKPITLHVAIFGDSVTLRSPEYQSVLRKGLKVNTTSVLRVSGDKLVGNSVAHYAITTPDSVLELRSVGTKVPK